MKRTLLICLCVAVISVVGLAQTHAKPAWKEFHPQEGWFTLEFPGDFARKVDDRPLTGRVGPSIEYSGGLLGTAGVVVKCAEFSTAVARDDKSMNDFYDRIQKTVVEGMKARLVTQRSITASTTLGRELEYTVDTKLVKHRMFYTANNRFLQFIVVIPGASRDDAQLLKATARFFASVKITEKQ